MPPNSQYPRGEPGPIVVNIGAGFIGYAVVLVFAVIGTFLYGLVRNKLPH